MEICENFHLKVKLKLTCSLFWDNNHKQFERENAQETKSEDNINTIYRHEELY